MGRVFKAIIASGVRPLKTMSTLRIILMFKISILEFHLFTAGTIQFFITYYILVFPKINILL